MLKVSRMSDRKVKVGDYVFHLAPLSYTQKAEINSHVKVNNDIVTRDLEMSAYTVLKHSLKAIDGPIKQANGSDYELEFTCPNKLTLSDDCLSEVLNIKWPADILFIANNLIDGIPEAILNPLTGEAIEGISIVHDKVSKKKKSK